MPQPRPVPLTADPGVYNVVDDQRVAQSVWLPAFAKFVGAPEPPTVSEEEALRKSGSRFTTPPDSAELRTRKQKASWHSVRDRSNGSGCEQAQRSEDEERSFLSERRRRAVTRQTSTDPNPLDKGKKIGVNLGCVRCGNTVWRAGMAFSVPCCRSLNRKSICRMVGNCKLKRYGTR
jgi:hypothetical protein